MPLIPLFIQNEVSTTDDDLLSAFNWCNPFDHILPFGDGTVGATDRAHLWGLYAGIITGEVVSGPFTVVAAGVFVAGAVESEVYVAGAAKSEVFTAGATEGQVSV